MSSGEEGEMGGVRGKVPDWPNPLAPSPPCDRVGRQSGTGRSKGEVSSYVAMAHARCRKDAVVVVDVGIRRAHELLDAVIHPQLSAREASATSTPDN